ncbi:type II secretion system protein GspC [Psychrobium sp. 1_MG-2023]|uniref:type II secretion system protein GspC n=1 Tax=Psychrobium sp. 1_MG-2023 TaxID=3062624 RepID=UPI002736D0B7|nr:type II secretion system protein GspC [Psychrobium sp. 1_MG-2023]MDP2561930.1 type II secretion system protein GspC [Psychrobium sp. 1_MG-2023]
MNKIMTALALPMHRIANVIFAMVLVFVLYLIAELTWLLLTPEQQTIAWKPTAQEVNTQSNIGNDYSSFTWFGKANEAPKAAPIKKVATEAPKTRLKVTLTGVVAHNLEERSMAIIEHQGSQETYIINQKIKSTRATVSEIHPDRVILKNNGRFETLMLDGFDYTTKSVSPSRMTDHKSSNLNAELAKTRREILKNPGKITDYISITPVKRDGKIKGYRLNAGRNPALFNQSGLKPNDLATAINSYDLTDMSQAMQVMAELKNMNELMITVEREGQLTDIQFALPQ